MNSNLKDKQQNSSGETLLSASSDNFDFELWATVVKRQMLASLQKKEKERLTDN